VANIKSQKKRNITNAKRAERNKAVRSELKTRVKTAVRAADGEGASTAMAAAQKRIDKAAAKGVIHANKAARTKSRMMHKAAAAAS
jgi:small subunit ribosomal protein S20